MVVNDDVGFLGAHSVLWFIASKLAPTGSDFSPLLVGHF